MTLPARNQDKKKVLLGLSGGVDSAVCCALLKSAGYEVFALYAVMSDVHLAEREKAERAAAEQGIRLYTLDLRDQFEKQVISPFVDAYLSGVTPNPCVLCNPLIKLRALADYADQKDIPLIATGHYARIGVVRGHPVLRSAQHVERDQSYMLYRVGEDILRRLLLPLGELSKSDVRGIAADLGLSSADAKDSQEICFVQNGGYGDFLKARGKRGKTGYFLSPEGERLTRHKGIDQYTIGQRKGLSLSMQEPVYVSGILPDGNIQLAYANGLFSTSLSLTDFILHPWFDPRKKHKLFVKIRSAAAPVPCSLINTEHRPVIRFFSPQRAVTPGQSAVLYQGELVAGGGIIKEADPLEADPGI